MGQKLRSVACGIIFYLTTRKSHPIDPFLTPLIPGSTLLPSILLFYTSITTLLTREIDPDNDLAGCWRQIFFSCFSAYVYTLINFTLSITHFIPQLVIISRTKSGEGWSILSLGLQI